jgi:hypothetical protein
MPSTIAYVHRAGDARALAERAGVAADAVEEIVDQGEDTVELLQDRVWSGEVARVILPGFSILGPDIMAQEMILSGWIERGIGVFSEAEPDLGDGDPRRRQARAALGEIDAYGKIPWVP